MNKVKARKERRHRAGKTAEEASSRLDADQTDVPKTCAPDGLAGDQRNPLAPPINIKANG